MITSWNAAAERMYGYTAAEIIGRSTSLLIPPEMAPELMSVFERVRQGEGIENFETRLCRKDGSIIEVLLTDSPIRDASGAVVGISAITRDMTERNRTHARFLALLEAAPDATVCVDSGGQIVLVNAQAERLFGYPREELAGQPVEILVPDAIKAAHPALRAGYATDPQPRQLGAGLDLSGRRRDGTTFPAEISLSASIPTRASWYPPPSATSPSSGRPATTSGGSTRTWNPLLLPSARPANSAALAGRVQRRSDRGLRRYPR